MYQAETATKINDKNNHWGNFERNINDQKVKFWFTVKTNRYYFYFVFNGEWYKTDMSSIDGVDLWHYLQEIGEGLNDNAGAENDFLGVCSLCLNDDNLVNEFCRLKGLRRPDKRSPIEAQIDNVCEYDVCMEFMRQFTDFMREREFAYIRC